MSFQLNARRVLRRLVLALCVSASPLLAAEPAATVRGTVTDTLGAPLPNATIIVAELGLITTSNAEGKFLLRGLAPAEYHLSITLIGFAPAHEVVRITAAATEVDLTVRPMRDSLRKALGLPPADKAEDESKSGQGSPSDSNENPNPS